MEVRRQWSNIFKGLRVKKSVILCLLTPFPNLFESRSWMMTFIDIPMLKDFITRKATQQEKLTEPSKEKGTHMNWNSWWTQRKWRKRDMVYAWETYDFLSIKSLLLEVKWFLFKIRRQNSVGSLNASPIACTNQSHQPLIALNFPSPIWWSEQFPLPSHMLLRCDCQFFSIISVTDR